MKQWHKYKWLFNKNACFSIGYYPQWSLKDRNFIWPHYNGWSLGYPCLDMTLKIGKLDINFICFKMPFRNAQFIKKDE